MARWLMDFSRAHTTIRVRFRPSWEPVDHRKKICPLPRGRAEGSADRQLLGVATECRVLC